MKPPTISGTISRRFLINFRVKEEVLREVLPAPFEPKLYKGWGMAGICLIRLEKIRPKRLSLPFGISSENAAHRFAVHWEEAGLSKEGVYVPRRDSDSMLNHIAGGRLFPGIQHRAIFSVEKIEEGYDFSMNAIDGAVSVHFLGKVHDQLPEGSIFSSLNDASRFFEAGSIGYSDSNHEARFEGMVLQTNSWKVYPFKVSQVSSSYFADKQRFPEGSIEFDHALFMENIPHEWQAVKNMDVS